MAAYIWFSSPSDLDIEHLATSTYGVGIARSHGMLESEGSI